MTWTCVEMFDYIGSLVVQFQRIMFIQAIFQIYFEFVQCKTDLLVLKMISNRMSFMNERQMSKFFQIFYKKFRNSFSSCRDVSIPHFIIFAVPTAAIRKIFNTC